MESEREDSSRYFFAPEQGEREEITNEVNAEREAVGRNAARLFPC